MANGYLYALAFALIALLIALKKPKSTRNIKANNGGVAIGGNNNGSIKTGKNNTPVNTWPKCIALICSIISVAIAALSFFGFNFTS